MSLFEERLADLPLRIEGYALERLQRDVSSAFTRVSTVIRMHGAGEEGVGEDVTYDAEDHDALQAAGPALPLAGSWTLGSFCEHVESLALWPKPPLREPSRLYRVWAYESTALDLALRQAGTSLHAAVGREPRPLRFVVSLRLGEPPTLDPVSKRLDSGEAGLRETLELVREGRGLVEFCAGELEAVGQGLEELRLEELVARLEQ